MKKALLFLFTLISVSLLHAQTPQQQHKIDSLTQELAKEELADSLRNFVKLSLADVYIRIKPDTAILIAQKVFDASKSLGIQAKAKRTAGKAYAYQSDLIESIKQLKEGIELAQQISDTLEIAKCMHALGGTFMEKGEYPPAIEYLFQALKSYELLGEDRRVALANNDLGLIFHEQQLYDKSKKHHETNLKIGKKLQDVFLQLIANNNIGLVYEVEENYKQALVHYHEALELNKEFGDKPGNSLILSNIAECHLNLKEYEKGIAFGLKSLEEAKAVDYRRVIARSNSILGALYTAKGDAKEAIQRLEKSLAISRNTENNQETLTSLLYIHEAYYQNKQFAKAYDAFNEYTILHDSLTNLTQAKKLMQKEGEHKDEIHRLEQEKNKLAHQSELKQQSIIRNSLIGGVIMMLVLVYVMFRSAQAKKKVNTILRKQQHAIQHQNEELASQNEQISHQKQQIESALENIQLLSAIGHDLNSTLDLEAVLMMIYERVNQLMDASIFGIGLYSPKDEHIEYKLAIENGVKYTPYIRSLSDKRQFAVWCVEQQRPIFIHDIELDADAYIPNYQFDHANAHIQLEDGSRSQEAQSLIYLPLISKEEVIGVLSVQSFRKNAYNSYQENLLKNLAVYIASALENAKHYQYIEEQKEEIEQEKNKSDKLLLNILPKETANELKQYGMAKPRFYESATVLFSDFVGFTQISEQLTANELVSELDTIFQAFDGIISSYDLEKIKTIGDAYMCAGGIPVSTKDHPTKSILAALEMQKFIHNYPSPYGIQWQLRLGIHTGPLTAGVVGKKKFAYDIWGDTVNTASRMESSGQHSKVNISGSTYELVKDHFNCEHRGKVKAKNKGEIDMYFIHP